MAEKAGGNMTEVGEAAAKPLLMRVQHAAQHKLAASVDDFDAHKTTRNRPEPGNLRSPDLIISSSAVRVARELAAPEVSA